MKSIRRHADLFSNITVRSIFALGISLLSGAVEAANYNVVRVMHSVTDQGQVRLYFGIIAIVNADGSTLSQCDGSVRVVIADSTVIGEGVRCKKWAGIPIGGGPYKFAGMPYQKSLLDQGATEMYFTLKEDSGELRFCVSGIFPPGHAGSLITHCTPPRAVNLAEDDEQSKAKP